MKKKSRFLSVFLAIMFLSGQVFAGNISGNVTGDQKDALDGANSPSSTNVVATMDDVASLDTGVQTASGGVNITNSGTAKNPIFDLDISEDVNMNTDYQLINLQAPAALGEAIRQTAKIDETKLESLYDNRITSITGPLDLTTQTLSISNVNNTDTDGYLTWEQFAVIDLITDKVNADSEGWDAAYTLKGVLDALNGLIKGDGAGNYSAVTDNSSDWNTVTNKLNSADTGIFALITSGRPFTGEQDFEDGIKADTIIESTADAGVDIESVHLEDGEVQVGAWKATDVGVEYGGTGLSALTAHKLIVGNGTSAPNLIDVGTNGQMLLGQTDGDPSWQTMDTDATMDETGTMTIAAEAVTYAKMQHISATARLLGRSTAGAGDVEEITVGGDITQSGSDFTIGADKVSYDKMQDTSATDVILGRSTAGAGTVEEIACTATGRAILAANALTRYLHWSPAYNGYALSADGSDNDAGDSGILVAFAGTLGDSDNNDTPYIEWSSTESGVSDYDVIIRIPIPSGYSSIGTMTVDYMSDTVSEDTATVYVYDSTDTVDSGANGVTMSSSTWDTESLVLAGTYTAGNYLTVKLHLECAQNQKIRVGKIKIPFVATR